MYVYLYFFLYVIYIYVFQLLSRVFKMLNVIIVVSNDWENFILNIFFRKEEIFFVLFDFSSQKFLDYFVGFQYIYRFFLVELQVVCCVEFFVGNFCFEIIREV